MRYEREVAERYSQHAKMLRLIATYDDHEPTRRAILKIARGYEQIAQIAIDQPDQQRQESRV